MRALDSSFITEIAKSAIRLAFFVEAEFDSGTVRFWSGISDIVWNAVTWTGAGNLLNINPAKEPSKLTAAGIDISLDGVDPAIIDLALVQARQNKPVTCWFGFMDQAGAVVVSSGSVGPYLFFKGKVDILTIRSGPETASVILKAENELISLNRARIRRYTHNDQQIEYPGDLGLEHVDALGLWTGDWGSGPGEPEKKDTGLGLQTVDPSDGTTTDSPDTDGPRSETGSEESDAGDFGGGSPDDFQQ